MGKKKLVPSSDLIVQSNDLIEAVYDSDLTATEHKVLRYAASKIKKNPGQFPNISFGVKEFMDAAGLKGNNYHSQIIKIADELTRKRIKLKHREKMGWFPWLSALVYEEGTVHLSFNTLIKDMLFELEGQFTKYSYQYIGDMRSGYSIRLFELLKQYASIGKRKLELETLKNMLGVANKYPEYGQFKLRVLKQAKKELDKKEDLTFEFEEIKEGRKVKELVFYIDMKNQKQSKQLDLFYEENIFVKEAQFLLENYNLDIHSDTLKQWEKYGIDLLSQVLEEIKDRTIDHYPSYIQTILESKYQRFDEQDDHSNDQEGPPQDIIRFIHSHKSKEVIPSWLVKQKFEEFFKGKYSSSELKDLWEKHEDHILDKVHVS